MITTNFSNRDPRETLLFRSQVESMLLIADKSLAGLPIRDDDDFGFMVVQFLYKQIQHAESILLLVPRRDAGLIARTMIDGLYQTLWTYRSPNERAKRWRSFSIIHDWRLMQARLREGTPVDALDIRRNDAGLKKFGHIHLTKKPKPLDPYHKTWRGGVSLSDIADVVGRELYDGPYSELSDWEHWGVSGIGEALSRTGDQLSVCFTTDRVGGLSLLAAHQCLFQTLVIADTHLSLNIGEALKSLIADFTETLESLSRAT